MTERILKEEKADLIAMGRQIFADPEFPRKIQEGREKEVIACLSCRYCQRLYFGDRPIECVKGAKQLQDTNCQHES